MRHTPSSNPSSKPPAYSEVIEIRDCRYGHMLAFSSDTVITRSLRMYGEWSEHEISRLLPYIRSGSLVLDVGANIGTHSLAFARRIPKAHIWGFEPQPLVSSLAWINCARNGAPNAKILQVACGERLGTAVIGPPLSSETNVGAFAIEKVETTTPLRGFSRALARRLGCIDSGDSNCHLTAVTPPYCRVQIAPLDSFCFPLTVSLIKIDCEGMEYSVLLGARKLIARDNPVVYFEALSTMSLGKSFRLLSGMGYRLFWLETHPFNVVNFRAEPENVWWRTEMGILAIPRLLPNADGLQVVLGSELEIPFSSDSRTGISVGEPADLQVAPMRRSS